MIYKPRLDLSKDKAPHKHKHKFQINSSSATSFLQQESTHNSLASKQFFSLTSTSHYNLHLHHNGFSSIIRYCYNHQYQQVHRKREEKKNQIRIQRRHFFLSYFFPWSSTSISTSIRHKRWSTSLPEVCKPLARILLRIGTVCFLLVRDWRQGQPN